MAFAIWLGFATLLICIYLKDPRLSQTFSNATNLQDDVYMTGKINGPDGISSDLTAKTRIRSGTRCARWTFGASFSLSVHFTTDVISCNKTSIFRIFIGI